jgi:hypothetical protein
MRITVPLAKVLSALLEDVPRGTYRTSRVDRLRI